MSKLAEALDRIAALEAKIAGMGHNGGPPFEDDDRDLIPDAEVAYRLGVCVRTLARYDERPALKFPKVRYVGKRRFRVPAEVAKWVRAPKPNKKAPEPRERAEAMRRPGKRHFVKAGPKPASCAPGAVPSKRKRTNEAQP
jgi:hypothetical protein